MKNLFAHCAFHKLKEGKSRIKPCDSIDNAFLRLFNQLQYCRFFIIFTMIVSIIHYLLLQLINSKVISNIISGWWLLIGFLFFPSIFRDFLLFAFCLSGSCTDVRKDTKTISSLGSIYNSSLNGLYLSNKRRFRQVPRMETDTLNGILNPPLTRGVQR